MANCCMTVWRFGDLVDTVVQMSVRRSVFVSLFSHATIGQIKKTSTGFIFPIVVVAVAVAVAVVVVVAVFAACTECRIT